jgi:hypothetical protein
VIRAVGKTVVALALLLGVWSSSAQALSLQQIGGRFTKPVYITSDPGNPERLFVVERRGTVQLVENGNTSLFADISPFVSAAGEGGLLSIALAPDFGSSGRLFVYYTGPQLTNPDIHVAELVAVGGSALLSTPRNLLTIPHPNHDNHYGGQLQFGPEGNLFVSTGDGGGENDVEENAQSLSSLLGKILRIHPNPSAFLPYTVPDNPFAGNPPPYDTIWSYGLRNPFRFSFDRLTGDLWIGDVGQDKREEVDFAAAPGLGGGSNYGWNCREGRLAGPATDPECASPPPGGFVDPVFDYPKTGGCAALIGGYVARGPGMGDLSGRYLYGDLCSGQLRSFSPAAPSATDRAEGLQVPDLNSFGQDSCGRLYAVSGEGFAYRLLGPGAAFCTTIVQPASLTPSFVRIRALRRNVKRNRRAFVTAFVSPCPERRGDRVTLWQGRRRLGTRRLDRVCSVRFRPRVKHRIRFQAKVAADGTYAEATSRRLTIRVLHRHRKHR